VCLHARLNSCGHGVSDIVGISLYIAIVRSVVHLLTYCMSDARFSSRVVYMNCHWFKYYIIIIIINNNNPHCISMI